MSLSENGGNNGFYMPVAPAYAMNGGNGGFGGYGGDWGWIILLLLLAGGGWGNGFGGGFMGGNMGYDFPWLMTGQQNINTNTNNGFRDAMLNDNITSVRDGINNLSTQLCNTGFSTQTALLQGFNQLGSQLADCCCENRLATADLKYTIATENCADRAAVSDGIRDVITNQTANTQRILDQLCQDKIDAKNEKIADLERQLTMADLRASQIAQTAQIRAGQVEEIDAMYNRLRDCPVPTMPVYGSQPIFACNNNGCGCGCGGNNF
jgi:hypothetical protein